MRLTHNLKETIRGAARPGLPSRTFTRGRRVCDQRRPCKPPRLSYAIMLTRLSDFAGPWRKRTHIPAKSLMRMLGSTGNPSAANLSVSSPR